MVAPLSRSEAERKGLLPPPFRPFPLTRNPLLISPLKGGGEEGGERGFVRAWAVHERRLRVVFSGPSAAARPLLNSRVPPFTGEMSEGQRGFEGRRTPRNTRPYRLCKGPAERDPIGWLSPSGPALPPRSPSPRPSPRGEGDSPLPSARSALGLLVLGGWVLHTFVMDFTGRALELAEGVVGGLAPRPAVGAVVVARDGVTVVGEGATRPHPGPHAEAVALAGVGELAKGGTIYCTLEPHQNQGTTAPCTRAIINAGVKTVVCPVEDPNPVVAGRGFEQLRAAGVEVVRDVGGENQRRAEELIEGFAKHVGTGLPFVTVKWAMSLDGKIATRSGDSQWITGEEARAHGHGLRYRSDAVMTGIGTVLADDPRLTARDMGSGKRLANRPYLRVVVDSKGRMPGDAVLLDEDGEVMQVVASGEGLGGQCEVVRLSDDSGKSVDVSALMVHLGDRGVHNVLVEAGEKLTGALFDRNLVDKVVAYVSTERLIGGIDARSPVGGDGPETMHEITGLKRRRVEDLGSDLVIIGYVGHRKER